MRIISFQSTKFIIILHNILLIIQKGSCFTPSLSFSSSLLCDYHSLVLPRRGQDQLQQQHPLKQNRGNNAIFYYPHNEIVSCKYKNTAKNTQLFSSVSSSASTDNKEILGNGNDTTAVSHDNNNNNNNDNNSNESVPTKGAIAMTIPELAHHLGGLGRAQLVWDMYKVGIDPLTYYLQNNQPNNDETIPNSSSSTTTSSLQKLMTGFELSSSSPNAQQELEKLLPTQRKTQKLGQDALLKLKQLYQNYNGQTLENGVASLSNIHTSSDGTTKLVLKFQDGLEVETVIIPWVDKGWSTICVSSQVGCRQGCTFCATGRMGKLRSLTTEEILVQFFYALKICRIANIPAISNVVFMGMGEPSDNAASVIEATKILTNVDLFHMGQGKVTISTVAPEPNSFLQFKDTPCVLAWSVHAANDTLRRKLVPTTKYTMEELRQGLIETLLHRPKKLRATMIEVALISNVNDTLEAAEELANFALGLKDSVPGIKLSINLIPFNDIGHPTYNKPTKDAVRRFQKILWERGLFAPIRTTRGDDESAACGQLATKKK